MKTYPLYLNVCRTGYPSYDDANEEPTYVIDFQYNIFCCLVDNLGLKNYSLGPI